MARLDRLFRDETAFVQPALDRGGDTFLTAELKSEQTGRTSSTRQARRAEVSARLMLGLPSFPHLPVDELIDLRQRLSPQLARFRATIGELELAISESSATSTLTDAIEELQLNSIEPELAELNEAVRAEGGLSTVARGVPLTATGLLGLGMTTMVGGPVLASAAAVGAGLSVASAREYLRRKELEKERKRHRLYVLWQVQRATGG